MKNEERFSNRVDSYMNYRPSYPKEAIDYLYNSVGLHSNSKIADVGSGTGIFSKLLLERGSYVIAVEPNQAMRAAAEQMLENEPNFQTISGSAESTGLADRSVEFIVSAQAFHWFDRLAAETEFRRILQPGGKVVLIWNSRLTTGNSFRLEYDQLLHAYGTDYEKVNHKTFLSLCFIPFQGRHNAESELSNESGVRLRGLERQVAIIFLQSCARASQLYSDDD